FRFMFMTGGFLLAASPTLLQSLGDLTIANLLGVILLVLLVLRIIDTRDFSFLRNRQVRILLLIGAVFVIGTINSYREFPTLKATVGVRHKGAVGKQSKGLDKTEKMGHEFYTRIIYLVFFLEFVRDRRDIRLLTATFMIGLFFAVPSAIYNIATGQLARGFRVASSVTSGS